MGDTTSVSDCRL